LITEEFNEQDRIRDLAQSLDCIAEPDLCLLANITPNTAESWRKRGKGPAYVLIGNRYLYPRTAVSEFVQQNIRERHSAPVKEML
jgi:hypothetical protein